MTRLNRYLSVACGMAIIGGASSLANAGEESIVVRTSHELSGALITNNAGKRIHILRGEYTTDRPLTVPDGATLVGDGVMLLDADGTPSGFEPGTETIIRATAAFDGDLLTIGNGAGIRGLIVQDFADTGSAHRIGNSVGVVSRSPGDVVVASIDECEIFNPNPMSFGPNGPTGRGLAVLTQNPDTQLGQPPHEGATLNVRVEHTIIQAYAAGDGDAVFVINFASRAKNHVVLSHNRFEGMLTATGGTSRPERVTEAETTIESDHNVYLSKSNTPGRQGWLLLGATSSPHIAALESAGPGSNVLRVHSRADRIEGFVIGIRAAAGRRVRTGSGPVSDNALELDVTGLRISTWGAGAADLLLYGALAQQDPDIGREFHVGDRNTLRAHFEGVSGSGMRANVYAPTFGPSLPANHGTGNRVEIVGDPAEFARSNTGLEPTPPVGYFIGRSNK